MPSIKKSIAGTFLSKTTVSGLGLLTVILISKLLGPEGRGQISLFMSSVALLQLFCDYGNNTSIINLSYTHSVKNIRGSALLWTALLCVLAFPLLALFFNIPYYWLIPLAAFLYTFTNLNHLSLMGQRQVALRNYSLMVFPLVLFFGFFVFSLFQEVNTSDYFPFLFLALLVSALVSWLFYRKHQVRESSRFKFEWDVMKNGMWVQTGQAIQFLNYRLNFFLVAFFISDAALGIFNNAVILCESLWILGHSIGQIQHLNIVNNSNQSENRRLTNQLIGKNVLGTLILLFVLILVPNTLWIALFSVEFESMRSLFIYLAPGILAFSVSNIIYHYLHAVNRFKEIVVCNLIGLLSGLAASLLLIPSNGLIGASISWSLGLLVAMICYVSVFYRFHGNKIK